VDAYTSGPSWGEAFTIDAWGNLTNKAQYLSKTQYEPLNAAPATANNQLTGYGYDAAGNMTTGGYTYDPENRLATAGGVTYTYDGDGFRMEKSPGAMYWPGPWGTLTETDLTGIINEEYIYFNGQRVARVDRPSGTVHYYFSDHLGSASVITDASGNVQARYFYYPYGRTQSSTGSDPNHYKFTGKERDSESGLDNFDFRYFGSSLGRFMQPDDDSAQSPLDPQSWNLYSYVENKPLNHVDPDGHDCVYTSNQTSQSVTVTVEQGACSDVANGTYISGTIDVNSLKYNGQTGDLSYSFQDSSGENGGVGVIALNAPPPPGQLSSDQAQILSRAGAMGMAGVKWGAIEMGQQALGIGLGRLAAWGIETAFSGKGSESS
jgi:RHS repeat-associated protein